MPKPNYSFAKRQRELAKKQKQEEKRQRKAEQGTRVGESTDDESPTGDQAALDPAGREGPAAEGEAQRDQG